MAPSEPSRISPWPRRLRVGHVTLGLETGGQEKLLVEFARWTDRARFDLHFISLTGPGRQAETLQDLGWPVTSLNIAAGFQPGLFCALARTFERLHLDVLHTHDDKPLIYGSLAAQLAGVRPVLHTHHHGWLPQTTARQHWLLRLASRMIDRFVCVSHDSARHFHQVGVPSHKLLTLWNGIDLHRFAYTGPAWTGPAVCVARLSQEKGLDVLLDAIPEVVRACPDFRLEIAGGGPLHAELEKKRVELQIENHVRLLGEVRDVPELLGRARLFVLPSRSEGISLTVLEAMARGLPVVATQVGGNPEVVQAGRTGLLVPPEKPHLLAQALLQLWKNPDQSQTLGLFARQRVEEHFDIRRMVACYEALYRQPRAFRARNASQPITDFPSPLETPRPQPALII